MILDTVPCSVIVFVVFIVNAHLMRLLGGDATAFAGCRT
jgi:hypothetical protein